MSHIHVTEFHGKGAMLEQLRQVRELALAEDEARRREGWTVSEIGIETSLSTVDTLIATLEANDQYIEALELQAKRMRRRFWWLVALYAVLVVAQWFNVWRTWQALQ